MIKRFHYPCDPDCPAVQKAIEARDRLDAPEDSKRLLFVRFEEIHRPECTPCWQYGLANAEPKNIENKVLQKKATSDRSVHTVAKPKATERS